MIIHSPFPFPLLSTPPPTHTLQDGTREVAVKVVRKEFFKQDSKVRENPERETRILTVSPAGIRGAVSQEEQVVQFHLDALWNTLPCIQLQEEEEGLMVHCVV